MKKNRLIIAFLCFAIILPARFVMAAEKAAFKLPSVGEWQPQNFQVLEKGNDFFRGRTIFEAGIKTPCLYSPEFALELRDGVVFGFQLQSMQSSTGRLFFRRKDAKFNDQDRVDFQIRSGKEFSEYQIFLPKDSLTVVQFRLDLFIPGAEITLRDFKILTAKSVKNQGLPIISSSFLGRVPDISVLPDLDGPLSFGTEPETTELQLVSGDNKLRTLARCSINFQSPAQQYEMLLDQSGTGSGTLAFFLEPYDIFGRSLPLRRWDLDLAAGQRLWQFTLPTNCAGFVLQMQPEIAPGNPVLLHSAKIMPILRKADLWQGQWIWHETIENPQICFFRKTFQLKEKSDHANLLLTMDDRIESIFLNGIQIPLPSNAFNVRQVDMVSIGKYLRVGRNVLAISGTDIGGQKGLLCELAVYGENEYAFFQSDNTFKVLNDKLYGWEKFDYDDSAWPAAVILPHVMARDLPHSYMGPKTRPATFRVTAARIVKQQLIVDLEIQHQKPGLLLSCSLQNEQRSFFLGNWHFDQLLAGHPQKVSFSLPFSYFIPAGKYQLKLTSETDVLPEGSPILVEIQQQQLKQDLPVVRIHYGDNDRTPRLDIDGRIVSFTHLFTTDNHQEQIRNLEANEVRQYWLSELQPIWKGSGNYDFTPVDAKISELLQLSSDAYVLAQIPVDTFLLRSMKKWVELYPNEVVLDADGQHLIEVHGLKMAVPSWGSDIWRLEIRQFLTALVQHVRKQTYASRVIGFMPIAGLGAEWMYYGAHNKLLVDYSQPFARKFQNWLKMRYQKIDNLNQAWKKNFQSFSDVSVPSPAERNQKENFSFLNPVEHQNVIDLRLFFSELTAGLIEEFASVIKQASDGRTLCGTYYGYITYTALDTWSENGHFALQKLLESDSIDFLVSLIRYDNRYIGGESGAMTPVNSFRLHQKAAVTQADLRTHRSVKANYMATDNLMDSAAILKRELAWALVSGAVFEFGYYGKGWIASDPRLMELIGKYQYLEQKYAGDKEVFSSTSGQIALIVDDASVNYVRQDSTLFRLGNRELIRQLAHVGTGFDTYLLSDLPKIADQYRCFIFSGTYLLSDDQLQYIQQHVQGGGRTLVWMHAPGICDGKEFLSQRVEKVTSIPMQIQNLSMKPATVVTATTRFLTPGTPASINRQRHAQIGPRLIPQQGEILACADDNLPAVVRQVFEDWTSVYSWTANLSPSVLQEIASTAGLTIINDSTDDSTYAAGRMIAIHSNHGGPRTLHVPYPKATQLTELFTGEKYPIEHGQCQLHIPPKSTVLFIFD